MTGYDYEQYVAGYLIRLGYRSVVVTKASGDYGVDITAYKDGIKYAIQCKYYSKHVGVSAVQEVTAGKAMYNCGGAMVVTNSSYTKAAEELARNNGVILLKGIVPHSTLWRVPVAVRTRKPWEKVKIVLFGLWLLFGLLLSYFVFGGIVTAIKNKSFSSVEVVNVIILSIYILIPFSKKIITSILRNMKSHNKSRKAVLRTQTEINKELEYFKNNYSTLTEQQKHEYLLDLQFTASTIDILIENANAATDIGTFITNYELAEENLKNLCTHEYTGFFGTPSPVDTLNDVIYNRYMHEINFIDKVYGRYEALNLMDDPEFGHWFEMLDWRTIDYMKNGTRYNTVG